MKKNILIALSCFFVLSNCSTNNEESTTPDEVAFLWHLVGVTGGIAGIDEQFDVNTIVWNFDDVNQTLVIDNKNTDDSLEDSLDSGTYAFSVLSEGSLTYLLVDGTEIGSFEINSNSLTIDQNFTSSGTVTDGFIYTFTRETIIIN